MAVASSPGDGGVLIRREVVADRSRRYRRQAQVSGLVFTQLAFGVRDEVGHRLAKVPGPCLGLEPSVQALGSGRSQLTSPPSLRMRSIS